MELALLAAVAIAAVGVVLYNRLARLRLLGGNAWADIDVQLKRRHDLVPTLVTVVKGHAGYERATLEAVVAARSRAAAAGGPAAAGEAERALAGSVRQLFAVAEAYPDLTAGESYLALQRSLAEIEDHIQHARRYYNAVVRDYNVAITQFPGVLVASVMGFRPREYFGLDDAAEGAPPAVDVRADP
jgi:LemA protein